MNDAITNQYRRMSPEVLAAQRTAIRKMLAKAPPEGIAELRQMAGAHVAGVVTRDREIDAILAEHGTTGALVTAQTAEGVRLSWVPFGVNVELDEARLDEWRGEAAHLFSILGLIEAAHGAARSDREFRLAVLALARKRGEMAPCAARVAPKVEPADVGLFVDPVAADPGIQAADIDAEE